MRELFYDWDMIIFFHVIKIITYKTERFIISIRSDISGSNIHVFSSYMFKGKKTTIVWIYYYICVWYRLILETLLSKRIQSLCDFWSLLQAYFHFEYWTDFDVKYFANMLIYFHILFDCNTEMAGEIRRIMNIHNSCKRF